jgi:hypothetical protein
MTGCIPGERSDAPSAKHRVAVAARGTRRTPDVNHVTNALYSSTREKASLFSLIDLGLA